MCFISPVSCWHSLAFRATRTGWWVNGKVFTILNLWLFFRLCFVDGEENQIRNEKPKVTYWGALLMSSWKRESRGWERKSKTGRFTIGRFWLCTWKISSVGKDQVNSREFRILKISPVVIFVVIQHISFHSRILFGDCRSVYFHSLINSTFLVRKGLSCLCNKQTNTWSPVDMEFLSVYFWRWLFLAIFFIFWSQERRGKKIIVKILLWT